MLNPYGAVTDVARYLVSAQLCRMRGDNHLTYWGGVAFVPWLDVVPRTWKAFSSLLTSLVSFGAFGVCNEVGFLLQPQMLNHGQAGMTQPVLC